MKSEWEKVKLGDIAEFINGRAYKQTEFKESGTPIVRIQNLTGIGNTVYSDLTLDANKYIDKQDLIYAWSATFGPYIWKGPKSIYHYHIWKLIPKEEKAIKYFIYYKLIQVSDLIRNLGTGSIFTHITKSLMENYEVTIPPLPIQKKIVHILLTLDDKIELNRKMNQTLEDMASAIFKSWFVDFDPVHAKANCTDEAELENIAKELGISKAILDLFPNEFEESELGMIPKGWEDTELSQVCKIQSGYAFKSAWWQDTGVKVIKIKNIDGNRVNTLDCECVSEEIATKNSNFKLSSGDFLIAMTGATVGKVGVIYTSDEEYLLNQRVGRFQPIKYYDEYVKIFASSSKFFESIQGQAQGSAQPNISAREIETVKIIKPNNEIMKVFSSLLNPFFSKILEHQGEIQTLEKTRDTLLPKLLSGEIDVSELKI
ncbi:restriction endonuclease subunit S [Aliarcobacter butzleri]|uniref:restriction endonuclease subunit S n=1 Tax=Aliarcobacter butzleri TaxID=28197 RepID=UPI002B24D065|nr:restriction endonuclease subunit S [Aliarcobacter butzleri]